MDNIYLITGAAGHLGSAIVKKLLEQKKDVRILLLHGEKHIPEGDVKIYYGNVCNIDSMQEFFKNPQKKDLVVIHCAGIVTIATKYSQKVYEVNVEGTKNIVTLCEKNRVRKLIYVSSVHAITENKKGEVIEETDNFDPDKVVGFYAKTKAQATAYVLEAAKRGLNASVVHPSGICGPYDNGRGHLTTLVIDYYKGRLSAGMKGGYDFVDVRDVADGIIACCDKGEAGQCYILSNKYVTVTQLLHILHKITGKRKIKTILPHWFIKLTAPLAEAYYMILRQPPLYTAYSIYTLNSNSLFSHKKATDQLGYNPRDISQTLQDTIEWLKSKKRI